MKDGLGTFVQLAGFACLVIAARIISPVLGLVLVGVLLVVVGHVLDGTAVRPPAWWRRRRDRRRPRRVA